MAIIFFSSIFDGKNIASQTTGKTGFPQVTGNVEVMEHWESNFKPVKFTVKK